MSKTRAMSLERIPCIHGFQDSGQKKEICYKIMAYNVDKIIEKKLVKNV